VTTELLVLPKTTNQYEYPQHSKGSSDVNITMLAETSFPREIAKNFHTLLAFKPIRFNYQKSQV
jgi:hypothetical protein